MEECEYSFLELARNRFPVLLSEFESTFNTAFSVEEMFGQGNGLSAVIRSFNKQEDFPGIYCFLDGLSPIYFGISQKVCTRLIQHTKSKSHYSASFAYKLCNNGLKNGPRKNLEKAGYSYLQHLNITAFELECPIERYLFEVYCSMKYATKWNSFQTH